MFYVTCLAIMTSRKRTVECIVAWPLNESEAGVDLVLMDNFLLFLCKFPLISLRTAR